MQETFADKLAMVLKGLSLSRARLAADLGVNKSVVGRWVAGTSHPTSHNLARLSELLAHRLPGFTVLDWDRDVEGLAARLRLERIWRPPAPTSRPAEGLPMPFMGQILAMTASRGPAFEGFFRSTRPFADRPGQFLHDHCMVRLDPNGLLRLSQATGGVFVDGWVLPMQEQLFVVGTQYTTGDLVFALLNAERSQRADVLDGIVLSPVLDAGRTPTASAIVLERIDDLSGERARDDARFAGFAARPWVAPDGSVPQALREHLVRDIGPAALALGGDWLLRLPLARSLAKGSSA
ncbi:MAG TPA: helix-turn-helix transcriptional regulator [Caulobacteraceae bacterium]